MASGRSGTARAKAGAATTALRALLHRPDKSAEGAKDARHHDDAACDEQLPPISDAKAPSSRQETPRSTGANLRKSLQVVPPPTPPPAGLARPAVKRSSLPLGDSGSRSFQTVSSGFRTTTTRGSLSFDHRSSRNFADDIFSADHAGGQTELTVDELVELARDCKWHLLGEQVPGNSLEYLPGTEAIVVLAWVDGLEIVRELSDGLAGLTGDVPPVLCLLMGVSDLDDHTKVMEAVPEVLMMGMEEVVCNCRSRQDVKLAIRMGMMRSMDKADVIRTIESQLKESYEADMCKRLEEIEMKLSEPMTGMFWQAAHRTFESFPHLDMKLPQAVEPGVRIGPCQLEACIGTGMFGSVYAATNARTGQREACKVIKKDRLQRLEQVISLSKEMHYLGRLKHENIVAILGTMQAPYHVVIRMEVAGASNLYRALRVAGDRFDPERARCYFSQIASAVVYFHSRGVAHCDMKPENIMLSEDMSTIKVVDFGTAIATNKVQCDIVGTIPFMAPEVLGSELRSPYWPGPTDVWSIGVVLLEMICGIGVLTHLLGWSRSSPPCADRCIELEAFFATRSDDIQRAVRQRPGCQDRALEDLWRGMLRVDAAQRWSSAATVASEWLSQPTAGGLR